MITTPRLHYPDAAALHFFSGLDAEQTVKLENEICQQAVRPSCLIASFEIHSELFQTIFRNATLGTEDKRCE